MNTLIDPLTSPLSWKTGVRSGFLLWPHTNGGTGWGEGEITTEAGGVETVVKSMDIPGGRNQNVLLGFKDASWTPSHTPAMQGAGNIDWVGGLLSPLTHSTARKIVTVNGPLSRYWNLDGAYAYDGNPKAEEIYSAGKVIGVCPKPVLGACLLAGKITSVTGVVSSVTWIIALCKVGVTDVAFAKPLGAFVRVDLLDAPPPDGGAGAPDASLRTKMRLMADEYENPLGWREVGSNVNPPPLTPYPPEAPWFFASDGKSGRTMRRSQNSFNNGASSVIEDVYVEYKCSVTMTSTGPTVAFILPETFTGAGFKYTEDHLKERSTYPRQTGEPAGDDWTEDHIEQNIAMVGEMDIAVDYDYSRSEWVYGSIVVDHHRRHSQYWMSRYLARTPTGFRRLIVGRARPTGVTMMEGDHYDSSWIGDNSSTKLRMRGESRGTYLDFYLGYGLSGSSTVANGQPPVASDPFLYFWDSMDFWPHHVDLRTMLLAGYTRLDQLEVQDVGFQFMYETMEWAGLGENESLEDTQYATKITRFSSAPVLAVNAFGFDYYLMTGTWAATFTEHFERTNFTGVYPVLSVPTNRASWRSYYAYAGASWYTDTNQGWTRRPFLELFTDPSKTYRAGVFQSLPTGAAIVAYEFYDETLKEMSHYERLWPSTVIPFSTLIDKGDRFHPGGVV